MTKPGRGKAPGNSWGYEYKICLLDCKEMLCINF